MHYQPPVAPANLRLDQVHRGRTDEAADEEVHWTLVELLRRRDLLEITLPHDGDAIAHRHRLDLVVRDVDRRDAELVLQARDLGAHVHAELRVEIREGLVHQVGLGLAHDRAAHGDALALAARERPWFAFEKLRETEDVGSLAHTPVDLGLRRLPQTQPERDVVVDREVRVERIALEDHRDVAIPGGHVIDNPIADADDALTDALEAGHHPQSRRLAAARGADEHHEFSVADLEIHPRDGARPVGVDLADSLEGHGCHLVSAGRLSG